MKKLLTIIAVAALLACNDAPPNDDKEPGDAKRPVDTTFVKRQDSTFTIIDKPGFDTIIRPLKP